MQLPAGLIDLIHKSLFAVQPLVKKNLRQWRDLAEKIPDGELRRQAMMSIETKAFHCQGGAILGLLAGAKYPQAIRFIVAYQTISDYLDNLCDRSTSLDPEDFAALHEAMKAALLLADTGAYYRFRQQGDDGGYLEKLVDACRRELREIASVGHLEPALRELCFLYCELQVYKHVEPSKREALLSEWFDRHRPHLPPMEWYEFAACTGSTLGIFAIVADALGQGAKAARVEQLRKTYFPWVQGLHILLDYLVDQEEDRQGGDLNFCSFYPDGKVMKERLMHFYRQAKSAMENLPDAEFHRFICRGLVATYLADRKASYQDDVRRLAGPLLRMAGWSGFILFFNCYIFRRLNLGRL